MVNPISTILTVVVLVIATVMILALTASIALVFTIGRKNTTTIINNNNNGNQSTITLAEPCGCGCPAISPQISARIVNGEAAVPNSWPWQLLLVDFTADGIPFSYCGASLITPKHVLTAAHCVFGWSPAYVGLFPRLHDFNISSWTPSVAYMAERIYVHESYDDRTLNDDVAVIRLKTPIPLEDRVSLACIAPADMTNQELIAGAPLVATGWGALESANRSTPNVLQQVRLESVSSSHPLCSPLVGGGVNARPGQMCAGFPPKAVCYGDSGGPLVRSITHSNGKTYWQQVGIMSGTVDCGYQTNFSDVYARVSYYNPWIIDKIRASP
jgi:secreted trypsin-like serine protease